MKKLKSIFAVLLSLALLTCATIFANAADASNELTVTAETVSGHVGDQIDVDINVTSNPGFAYFKMIVKYDTDALELVSSSNGFNVNRFMTGETVGYSYKTFTWINAVSNNKQTGTILTLTFEIKEGAASDTAYTIDIGADSDSIFDADENSVSASFTDGQIGVLPGAAHVEYYGTSMTLANDLSLNVWFLTATITGENYYAVITKCHDEQCIKEDEVTVVPYSEWTYRSGTTDIKGVIIDGLAASEMICNVKIQLFRGDPSLGTDGTPVSDELTKSVQNYAATALPLNAFAKYRTLLVDMLNYGSAAQIYFGHNTTNLANSVLTEEQKAYASSDIGEFNESCLAHTTNFYGTSLSLEGSIILNLYFEEIISENVSAKVTYTDYLGKEVTVEYSADDIIYAEVSGTKVTLIPIKTLAPSDYSVVVTCRIYDGDTPVAIAIDSVERYISYTLENSTNENLLELSKQIIKYSKSAQSAFGKTTNS